MWQASKTSARLLQQFRRTRRKAQPHRPSRVRTHRADREKLHLLVLQELRRTCERRDGVARRSARIRRANGTAPRLHRIRDGRQLGRAGGRILERSPGVPGLGALWKERPRRRRLSGSGDSAAGRLRVIPPAHRNPQPHSVRLEGLYGLRRPTRMAAVILNSAVRYSRRAAESQRLEWRGLEPLATSH